MSSQSQRASPEALLALANKERRGKLKIFLGAAPGVGKTYAMLTNAAAVRSEGRDVVIGLIETHGRSDTAALTGGIETLARRPVPYRNRMMYEFDLDAALARRPELILVDEYAHTNVPGSRHPKRWQDVGELLQAGIDVWTTLNIQHLESLNDVIQKITEVRVRETVPDSAFESADEVVLVDLPPDELIKRLAAGKVYLGETAAQAAEKFFRPQNLTALRELALRRAAERIDADLVGHMQARAIEGPWAAGERILACIGPEPGAAAVIRAAKRLADVMDAPWLTVTVERPGQRTDEAGRKYLDEAMVLASSLGSETRTLVGGDISGEIRRLARFENATQIVIGRSAATWWRHRFAMSLTHDLIRRADDIAVHVITHATRARRRTIASYFSYAGGWTPFLLATGAVAIAVAIGNLMARVTPLPNVSMIFLMAVLYAALRHGIWPALYASVLSFVAYNFFFISPTYTLTIAEPYEVFALAIFLVVAFLTATVAGRVREQARSATERVRANRRLYEFTRKVSGLAAPEAVAEGAASEMQAILGAPIVLLTTRGGGDLEIGAAWPPEDALDTAVLTAARWAFGHDEAAGAGTGTLPTVPWLFVPLRSPRGVIGAVGVGRPARNALDAEARSLLDTLAEQTGAALDRAALAREMAAAQNAGEAERIRNTLLSSISHDFRTPLASILGSATGLLEVGEKLEPTARRELLEAIRDEAQGLDEMVRNLLAITRIDSGALELARDWVDLREIVQRVVATARRRGSVRVVQIDLPPGLPLVLADATLVEQAITNIVGNALTHTPVDAAIAVNASVAPDAIQLSVTDSGPGIDGALLPHLFDRFVRGASGVQHADGGESTGLGLAIARGIMQSHGGDITVESPVAAGRGSRFILNFPRDRGP